VKVNCSVEENANLSLMLLPPTAGRCTELLTPGERSTIGSGKLLTLGHDRWMYLLRRWLRLPGSVSASSPGL
jgi:hypothetical protein